MTVKSVEMFLRLPFQTFRNKTSRVKAQKEIDLKLY